jgi:signal transduction histidine kinase
MAPTKVLYIEDREENRLLVRALLPRDKYTILEAADGLNGIALALKEQPAIILLDINLPGIDGYEVGVALRSFPTLRNTPIIAVTAYAMQGDRERTLVAGCDGYIAKPLDGDRFPQQVEEFVRGKRERLEEKQAAPFLRELNQRLVYRMVNQIEELERLNQQVARRALQLESLHTAVYGITSALDVRTMLERLLPELAKAVGTSQLTVELVEPAGFQLTVHNDEAPTPRTAPDTKDEQWQEVEWSLPLVVQQRDVGMLMARSLVTTSTKADDEQMLKIVASQVAIAVENARLYDGMARKVEELKQAQAQLIQAAKLAAIGEMAAQVAHEINNPLTSVMGFASLLVEELPEGSRLRDDAGLIVTEASRARDIVRDLLDFSRQRPYFPQECDLNAVLQQVVSLVRLQGGAAGVVIEEQYAAELPAVEVDPSRMKQVFLNMIANATQAMPQGGLLAVRTGASQDEVTVSFVDTGIGIAPDNLGRIFEPFFTTKSEISGTGLGLSVSLGIVRQHGGVIDVQSEVGKGTTFTVRIPRAGRAPKDPTVR